MPAQEIPKPSGPDAPEASRAGATAAGADDPDATSAPESEPRPPPDPAPSAAPDPGQHLAAAPLIARFGGIRPMAHKLGVPVSTVQGWKQRGTIPSSRLNELRDAATRHGIAVDDAELAPTDETEAPPPPPPPAGPPPAAPPGRGGTSAIVLSVLALVAALAAGALVLQDGWRRGDDPRLAALEVRLEELAARPTGDADLAARIDAVARQQTDTGDLTERLVALGNAVRDVESELEALASAPASAPTAANAAADAAAVEAALDTLARRADALDQAIIALNGQFAALAETSRAAASAAQQGLADAGQEIAALRDALDAAAATAATAADSADSADTGSVRAVTLSVAARQLGAAVDAGTPYEAAHEVLAALAGDDMAIADALDRLAPAVSTGIAPFHILRARFPAVARATVQAERASDDADWLDRAVSRAMEVVAVRRVGPALEGDATVAVVARAEGHIDAGNLAAAVDEMATLTGPAGAAASGWLADARARLAAAAALAAIERHTLALLDAAG